MRNIAGLTFLLLVLGCNPQARESSEQQGNTEFSQENQAQKTKRVNHGVRNVPPERMSRSQTSTHYRVSYQPGTDPIPLNDHFRLNLNIQDLKTSKPSADPLTISVRADMPEHNHGMHVEPQVTPLGKGQYEVKGLLFHMAGYWEFSVTVLGPDAEPEILLFGIEIAARPTSPQESDQHIGH